MDAILTPDDATAAIHAALNGVRDHAKRDVFYGTFARALAEFLPDPRGSRVCREFDAAEYGGDDSETAKRAHLVRCLGRSDEIGTGEPIAFMQAGCYSALIRAGASSREVARVAVGYATDRFAPRSGGR